MGEHGYLLANVARGTLEAFTPACSYVYSNWGYDGPFVILVQALYCIFHSPMDFQ